MTWTTKRSILRKALRIEHLEARHLFAGDVSRIDVLRIDTAESLMLVDPTIVWSPPISPPMDLDQNFKTFTSQAELESALEALVDKYWSNYWGKSTTSQIVDPFFVGRRSFAFDALAPITSSSTNWSTSTATTNTQYSGIDEADFLDMTDDGFLIVRRNSDVFSVDLRDPANIITTKLLSEQIYSPQLFVAGNQLITVAQYYPNDGAASVQTAIKIYDITDRSQAKLQSTLNVDGWVSAARLQDGLLTLVQTIAPSIPQIQAVTDAQGGQRYETKAEYFERNSDSLLDLLIPNYQQSTGDGPLSASSNVGSWKDIAVGSGQIFQGTQVLRINLNGQAPAIVGSEYIVGLNGPQAYVGPDNIYLTGRVNSNQTQIYKIDTANDGEVKATARVTVDGAINDMRWMDEYHGVLRVATLGQVFGGDDALPSWNWNWRQPVSLSANIFTLGEADGEWKVLGELRDVANGQQLLSANFAGDMALITTGELPTLTIIGHDPLHGIDLSDPSQPKELSELTIPGFTTYLQRIDATHWLGLGFDTVNEGLDRVLQVSLYETTNFADLRVVDSWTAPIGSTTSFVFGSLNALDFHFDTASGLLTLGEMSNRNVSYTTTPIFKVDVSAADPLTLLGDITQPEHVYRNFVVDDILVTIGPTAVTAHSITDLTKPLDQQFFSPDPNELGLYWWVTAGTTSVQYLLYGKPAGYFFVESVVASAHAQITINADQSLTIVSDLVTESTTEEITLTVRYFDGTVRTVKGNLSIYAPTTVVVPPQYVNAPAGIQLRLEDDNGQVASDLKEGDEAWVVVSVQDKREIGLGVFSAYVDVTFNSTNFEVIGSVEHLGNFINGAQGNVTANGIARLGGFMDGLSHTGEPQDLARFKIRLTNNSPITLTAAPVRMGELGYEFLLLGINEPINTDGIGLAVLNTGIRTMIGSGLNGQDLNGDGNITAIDVLLVVNYINALEDSAARTAATVGTSIRPFSELPAVTAFNIAYDLSGDGVVSGTDVLQIVNTINSRLVLVGEGESAGSTAQAIDQVLAADWNFDSLLRTRR